MSSVKRFRHESSHEVRASRTGHCSVRSAHPSAAHGPQTNAQSPESLETRERSIFHSRLVQAKPPSSSHLGPTRPSQSAGHDQSSQEDSEASANPDDDVIMAVEANSKGSIGCCYYVAEERTLLLMSDVNGGDSLEILEQCWCLFVHLSGALYLTLPSEAPYTAQYCSAIPPRKPKCRVPLR